MIRILIGHVKKQQLLLLTFAGALSSFAINVMVKKGLGDEVYVPFTLFLVGMMFISSGAFLGADNLILRFSKVKQLGVFIPKNIAVINLLATIPVIIGMYYFSSKFIKEPYAFYVYLLMIPVLFIIQAGKLIGLSSLSQVTGSLWKIICLFILFLLVANGEGSFFSIFIAFSSSIATGLLIAAFLFYKRKVRIELVPSIHTFRYLLKFVFVYALGLVAFSMFESVDRLILSDKLSLEVFADYAYFITITVFPINIISSYIGLKVFSKVKSNSIPDAFSLMLKLGIAGLIVISIYILLIWVIKDALSLFFIYNLIPFVLILSVIKFMSPVLSSYLSAFGEAKDVLWVNFSSLVLVLLVMAVALLKPNIYVVSYLLALLWGLRFAIMFKATRKLWKAV